MKIATVFIALVVTVSASTPRILQMLVGNRAERCPTCKRMPIEALPAAMSSLPDLPATKDSAESQVASSSTNKEALWKKVCKVVVELVFTATFGFPPALFSAPTVAVLLVLFLLMQDPYEYRSIFTNYLTKQIEIKAMKDFTESRTEILPRIKSHGGIIASVIYTTCALLSALSNFAHRRRRIP